MKKPSMEGSIENSNIVVVNGSESSSDSESGHNNYPHTHINGTKSLSSSSRRSSSSSLSESSSDDFFRVDALKFTPDASELASKSGENYASSSESSVKSEVDNSPQVQTSTYKVYNVASSQKGMSPILSPPIQVMDRSGTYDPTRIPSSVFERNNNNPLEWSIASNESLFSIHIGHNSFSRDHAIKFGEVRLSHELTKPVELNMFNRIPSVTIEEIESARESVEIESVQTSEESFKFKPHRTEDHNDVKTFHQAASSMSTKSSVTTTPSLEGGSTRHSFVPLKKRSRRFCYCCNCSWAFCHHKRPTCCHIWPSCKCSCSWLFCGFCNGDRSSPMMAKTERNSFVKTDSRRQHSDKEESETTKNWCCFQSKNACDFRSSASSWCCFQSKNACDFRSCCSWFSCPSCTCNNLSCTRWRCCC